MLNPLSSSPTPFVQVRSGVDPKPPQAALIEPQGNWKAGAIPTGTDFHRRFAEDLLREVPGFTVPGATR